MEHKKCDCAQYAPTVLRVFLGLLFLIPGLSKLFNPSGIIGMLGGLGFPAASLFGWIVILVEVFFGLAILLGYRLKQTVWPLVIVMLVAMITVTIPSWLKNPASAGSLLFHLLAIGGLVSLYFSGAGKYAIKCKNCK
jgi:putative oxidoreductase